MGAFVDKLRSLVRVRSGGSGAEAQPKLARKKRIAEKNERLRRLKERLEKKDRELAKLQEKLDAARNVRRLPSFFDRNAPVFFLLGYGKSGTTWLTLMLDAHPEILLRVRAISLGAISCGKFLWRICNKKFLRDFSTLHYTG